MLNRTFLLIGASIMICAAASNSAMAEPYQNRGNTGVTPLTGFYAGGFGGYNWSDADNNLGGDFDMEGGDYGIFVGYQLDRLINPDYMMGINGAIEAHYAWADNVDDMVGATTVEKDSEWGISFRPGLTFMNRMTEPMGFRPYGIIGYRQANYDSNNPAFDDSYDGFELGAGTELIAFNNFGVRLDYTHVWYGEENGFDPDEDNLRLGVAYHF